MYQVHAIGLEAGDILRLPPEGTGESFKHVPPVQERAVSKIIG